MNNSLNITSLSGGALQNGRISTTVSSQNEGRDGVTASAPLAAVVTVAESQDPDEKNKDYEGLLAAVTEKVKTATTRLRWIGIS